MADNTPYVYVPTTEAKKVPDILRAEFGEPSGSFVGPAPGTTVFFFEGARDKPNFVTKASELLGKLGAIDGNFGVGDEKLFTR